MGRVIAFVRTYSRALTNVALTLSVGPLRYKGRRQIELLASLGNYPSPEELAGGGSSLRPPALIPKIAVKDIINMSGQIDVLKPEAVNGNVSLLELIAVCKVARYLNPTVSFEIGTFDGRTSVNIAANTAPESRVFTLDLPQSEIAKTALNIEDNDKLYIDKTASGAVFVEGKFKSKITQLYGDSARFDFSPYYDKAQLVFVDGSHSYEYTLNDSYKGRQMLGNNQGAILWHDYDTSAWFGVTRALNELYQNDERFSGLRHLEGTALVILWNGGSISSV